MLNAVMVHEGLAQLIADARERAGLKQAALAAMVGCTDSYISMLESGENLPSPDMAHKLEVALRLKPGQLVRLSLAAKFSREDAPISNQMVRALLDRLGFTPDDLHRLPPEAWERLRKMISPIVSLELERYNHHGAPRHLAITKSVMIVEDEAKLVRVLTEALQDHGFEVRSAINGRAALHTLLTEQTTPDCILLDLQMPQMGGVEFLRKLRHVNTTSKVIVMTGHPDGIADLQALGVEGYFEKPFPLPAMIQKVEAVVQGGGDAP